MVGELLGATSTEPHSHTDNHHKSPADDQTLADKVAMAHHKSPADNHHLAATTHATHHLANLVRAGTVCRSDRHVAQQQHQ
jgi:hypothetical protein